MRWKRRAITIPAVLALTIAGTVLSPVIGAAVLLSDLARRRHTLPTVRTWLFVWQYVLNDSAEIVAAPLLWVAARFGTRLDGPSSIRRHERLQRWSVEVMARRATRFLGVRLEIDDDSLAALEPGPLIVVSRHVNVLDSSLPSVLYWGRDVHLRGVIMAEMLADPGFDLLYGRLGSVFVSRDNAPEALRAVGRLGTSLDHRTVAVIFPEGRLYRPGRAARAQERLTARHPERAKRLTGLRHLLPPRSAGMNALLDSAPGADVVVVAHAGLDRHPRFLDIARAAPLLRPIRVTAWRISRQEIPTHPSAREEWLDAQWQRVDAWIDAQLAR